MSAFRQLAPADPPPRRAPAEPPRVAAWPRLTLAAMLLGAGPVSQLLDGSHVTLNWVWLTALSVAVGMALAWVLTRLVRPVWEQRMQLLPWPWMLLWALAPLAAWPLVSGIDRVLATAPPEVQIATVTEPVMGPEYADDHGVRMAGKIVLLLRGPSGFEHRALPAYHWMYQLGPGSRVRVTMQRGGLGLWSVRQVQPVEVGVASDG